PTWPASSGSVHEGSRFVTTLCHAGKPTSPDLGQVGRASPSGCACQDLLWPVNPAWRADSGEGGPLDQLQCGPTPPAGTASEATPPLTGSRRGDCMMSLHRSLSAARSHGS